jgi:SAM-dependent methyltransferase
VPDDASSARARKGAADAGVLVEIEIAPPTDLPLDNDAFDLVVIDDTGSLLSALPAAALGESVRETLRILRPGGRLMVIGRGTAAGLSGLLSHGTDGPVLDPAPALEGGGFRAVRRLAEREGLVFVEGVKPR